MSLHRTPTTRRKFAFYLGLGLFGLSEKLQAGFLDDLAAKAMNATQPPAKQNQEPQLKLDGEIETKLPSQPDAEKTDQTNSPEPELAPHDQLPNEHWSREENSGWKWFQRETLRNNQWTVTGITTPINRASGDRYTGQTGYLDEELVPAALRASSDHFVESYEPDGEDEGQPNEVRRSRHGRPPSKWLRSLDATELRIWLKRVEVPKAGVSGMSFMTHLTRDHLFDAQRLEGLSEEEQAKLHSAAHYGY